MRESFKPALTALRESRVSMSPCPPPGEGSQQVRKAVGAVERDIVIRSVPRTGKIHGVWLPVLSALCLLSQPVLAQSGVATGVGTPFELAFWQSIDTSNDPSLYEAYLARFPNGTFAEIARVKIVALRGRIAAQTASPAVQPVAPPVVPVAAAPPPVPVAPPPPPPPPPPSTPVAPAPAATASVAPPATAEAAIANSVPANPVAAPVAASTSTLGQLLAALAGSQATSPQGGGAVPAVAPAPGGPVATVSVPVTSPPRPTSAGFVVPPRPAMLAVPAVALPARFCSAEARNAFHDEVYAPSVAAARHNNEAAVGYMQQLQSLYDRYQLSHDPDTMNAVVEASRAYQPVAQDAFAAQAALVHEFGTLMAVPVVSCAPPPGLQG
jgi:hypothetical protein